MQWNNGRTNRTPLTAHRKTQNTKHKQPSNQYQTAQSSSMRVYTSHKGKRSKWKIYFDLMFYLLFLDYTLFAPPDIRIAIFRGYNPIIYRAQITTSLSNIAAWSTCCLLCLGDILPRYSFAFFSDSVTPTSSPHTSAIVAHWKQSLARCGAACIHNPKLSVKLSA